MYRYSQAEIEDLVTRLDAEPPRLGDRPLCWDDVSAGDALPELIKGPLSLGDLITWAIAEGTPIKAGNLVHKELAAQLDRARQHPVTHWPVLP